MAFVWSLVLNCVTEFNADPSCDWTMDTDMSSGSSNSTSVTFLFQVVAPGTQINMTLMAAWPPDTKRPQDAVQTSGFMWHLVAHWGHGYQYRLQLW